MSLSFKVENVDISAIRDRAMFDSFALNKSYVIKDIGDELEVTVDGFNATLQSGEAVICGGSTLCEGSETLTLSQNQTGYLVIRVDLAQTGNNICKFTNVTNLVQENINDGIHYVYDLPLYEYSTNASGVSSITDVRDITSSPSVPTDHSSTENIYGLGTTAKYGHTKVINDLIHSTFANGESLSAYQGYVLKGLMNNVISKSTFNSYPSEVKKFEVYEIVEQPNSYATGSPEPYASASYRRWKVLTARGVTDTYPAVMGTISQIAIGDADNIIYARNGSVNANNTVTWGAWQRIITSKELDEALMKVTVNTGYTPNANNELYVYRWGKFVYMTGYINNTYQVPKYTRVFTIPSGYRPKHNVNITPINQASQLWLFGGENNGEISTQGTELATGTHYFSACWLIA